MFDGLDIAVGRLPAGRLCRGSFFASFSFLYLFFCYFFDSIFCRFLPARLLIHLDRYLFPPEGKKGAFLPPYLGFRTGYPKVSNSD